MAKLPMIYCSPTGDTKRMAHFVSEKAEAFNGIEEELRKVRDTQSEGFFAREAIIMGSQHIMVSPVRRQKPA
ncbi:MAG: hypothetical protein DRQ02_03425 [Candidatus Latescibacterota bacterium]|nr:MAG: hypothetical protein DRQ02_03425 [Candidatus Latescibacterota bacterium]